MTRKRARVPATPTIVLQSLQPGGLAALVDRVDLDGAEVGRLNGEPVSLRDACVVASRFVKPRSPEMNLSGAAVRECEFLQPDVVVLKAWRGRWSDVRISGGRLGVLEAYDGEWSCVEVVGCKIDFLNLRGSQVTDLLLRDCKVAELDLGEATLRRASLLGTTVGRLTLRAARLADVDLRGAEFSQISDVARLSGAIVDRSQLTLLAPVLAAELGIDVAES